MGYGFNDGMARCRAVGAIGADSPCHRCFGEALLHCGCASTAKEQTSAAHLHVMGVGGSVVEEGGEAGRGLTHSEGGGSGMREGSVIRSWVKWCMLSAPLCMCR